MAMARSWREFTVRLTSVYVAISAIGIVLTVALMFLLARWTLPEHKLILATAIPATVLASIAQFVFHRRWLAGTRRWFHGQRDADSRARVYRELIRFPWLGSALNFSFWFGITVWVVVARMIWLPEAPLYRDLLILLTSGANALVAWSVEFFLFRRIVFRLLESMDVDREVIQSVPRQPIVRKYVFMFGVMLVGAIIFGCTLAYGLNRDVIFKSHYRQIQDILMAGEILVYEYDFGDAIDVQSKLDALGDQLTGRLAIVPNLNDGVLDLEQVFAGSQDWYGVPYYSAETQRLGERIRIARPLVFGSNRATSTFLEYEVGTEALAGKLYAAFWKIFGTGLVVGILVLLATWMFMRDISRPVRLIRDGLHPTGEAFTPPPLVVTDDELLGFSSGVRAMFVRLRQLFHDLLGAYWEVKDERARLQEIAVRFQQRTQRDGMQINVVTNRLRELTDHVQDLGQQLEAMAKVSETIGQANRLMNDTMGNMQTEMGHIRTRVRDGRAWIHNTGEDLNSTKRGMAGLDRWVTEATQDFDLILKKFQDLVRALEPVDADLADFDQRVQIGLEHVATIHGLLSSETDRYSEGITLIEGAQDRLDEVMLQFQQVEAIREQIEMLSFQAAVVASQSTHYERDFRVVADEIRDLSERAAAGIQRIFTAIWMLDQQGKQTLQRILNSRHALAESLEVSRRAHTEAGKGAELSSGFVEEMHEIAEVIRDEAMRTERLVENLREPFEKGAHLRNQIVDIDETFQDVAVQMQKLEEISRAMEMRIHEQQDGLRNSSAAVDRISLNIRDLIAAGEGVILQSRTLRSLLERLVNESDETGRRIDQTLTDLQQIEEAVFRNESEVKRVSAELQSS